MAQFDVYKNRNASTATVYPLLLDVQHAVLDTLKTRIVIPLAITDKGQVKPLEVLAPLVEFEGEHYVLLTPQLSAVSVQRLTDPVGSLVAFRADIVAALDFAFTGF